jgi:hemerythrin
MTILTWNHAISVGVRAMDDQHAILMDTMNDLRRALIEGGGREQVSNELNRLILFTEMHFSSEERLLEQHGFPNAAQHREAHKRLLIQVRETTHHAQHSEDGQMRSLLGFLHDWYSTHIETVDQQYGQWFNERGIT